MKMYDVQHGKLPSNLVIHKARVWVRELPACQWIGDLEAGGETAIVRVYQRTKNQYALVQMIRYMGSSTNYHWNLPGGGVTILESSTVYDNEMLEGGTDD